MLVIFSHHVSSDAVQKVNISLFDIRHGPFGYEVARVLGGGLVPGWSCFSSYTICVDICLIFHINFTIE